MTSGRGSSDGRGGSARPSSVVPYSVEVRCAAAWQRRVWLSKDDSTACSSPAICVATLHTNESLNHRTKGIADIGTCPCDTCAPCLPSLVGCLLPHAAPIPSSSAHDRFTATVVLLPMSPAALYMEQLLCCIV